MQDVKTGYGCPTCEKTTGDVSELIARAGAGFICSKVPQHTWEDPEALLEAKPKVRFQQEQPKAAPQQNHTSMNVSIPVGVYNALLERFGDKMMATIAGLLNVLSEGEPMVLSVTDVERLRMMFPERPKSGSHLVGMIFTMQQDLQEAKGIAETAATTVKAYEGMSPGTVVVDLGTNYQYALDRAKSEAIPVKVWLDRNLKNALESTWF